MRRGFETTWGRAVLVVVALGLAACESQSLLTVDLATDLVPGREFTRLEATLSVDPPDTNPAELRRTERVVELDEDFLAGRRAAAFEGLVPGRYFVVLTLRASDDAEVITQVGEVEVGPDITTLTMRVTRDCVGVECPGSGPPGNLACLAGRCVDPRCSPESPSYCPPVDCEMDSDCTPPDVTCSDVTCVSGTCFVWSGGASCPTETWCDPDLGCVPENPQMGSGSGCQSVFCDVGNECEVGLRSCDDANLCQVAANAFAGTPCGRGECDGSGACVGLPLDVTREGEGTVVSEPARLDCDADTCRERFERDSDVVLTALPAEGFELTAWEGCDTTELDRCTVRMDEPREVTARFEPRLHLVQVTYSGSGTGTVQLETPGEAAVDCEMPGCTVQRAHGSTVTLTASSTGGSTFAGWGGACASEAGTTCTLESIDGALDVGVSFATEPDLLRVLPSGTGEGRIRSTEPGIDCGTTCSAPFTGAVTLEAVPAFGSTFAGWGGAAASCGTNLMCTVSVSGAVDVEVTWTRGRYPLTVDTTAGSGTGRVRSMPAAIDCPGTCTATFDGGETVTLLALPDANMEVVGWDGDVSCGAASTCEVRLGAAASVSVRFEPLPVRLDVARDGDGQGRVDSVPAAIRCGSTCEDTLPHGTELVLTATAETGSVFAGWTGGGCGVANPCTTTLTGDTSIRATFARARHDLTAVVSGDGSGTIRTDAFTCAGGPCTHEYRYGDEVSLYVDVTTGNFAGWGGACAAFGTAETCLLTITGDVMVSASFTLSEHTLSVGQEGDGTGTITSDQGIDCVDGGGTCTLSLTEGTMDRLVAVPASGSFFRGWEGACTGTGACNVVVDGPTVVTARFERIRHRLTVDITGESESARVASGDGSIACPSRTCEANVLEGAITLFADVAEGFVGTWSVADCGSAAECRVLVESDTVVKLEVRRAPGELKVVVTGEGGGQVDSREPPLTCRHGDSCRLEGTTGQRVLLEATPDEGSVLVRWDGVPSCSGLTCEVAIGDVETVTAIFGKASGSTCRLNVELRREVFVSSAPAGISCPGTCSAEFKCEDVVTLRAGEATTWSGCFASGDGTTCTVNFTSGVATVTVGGAEP